ncbi:putative dual specificity protein phosphatase [Schistosoma mansoni]|uniref:putative dual specificity protein phosphatase n=1 Tax=Schistosoma mansoni TaxID=6183 RepID=UPI0001A632E1|nr:putative dual specificity protein phosphatase [Schistosoma mansoni]|eukprot:XP_018655068.1 putative dual specificity protein phosphatase [Schistosoma mansoni]
MSSSKVIVIERPENSKSFNHDEISNTCGMVKSEIILSRLRKAKELSLDSHLIIVDMRETRLYQSGHILTARSANCYTKTMAKRAIQSWDIWYTETHGCPAPYMESPVSFISQISLVKPAIVVYDQRSNFAAISTLKDKKVRAELHFISALLDRGNRVYMIDDNFESNDTEKLISCLKDCSRDETLVVRIKQTPLRVNEIQQNNDDVLSASISQILPFLYLGNARDSQDVDLIRQLNVTHIINVTDTLPMPFRKLNRIQYLHIPATDTTKQNLLPSFDRAVQFIEKARKHNGIVLVHCLAGVSRSVAVVIAYLLYNNRGLNVYKALEFVQARRSVAGPNLHFMGQLQAYYHDLHSRKSNIFSDKLNMKSKDKLTKRNSAENLTGKSKRNNLPRSVSLSSNWIQSQSRSSSVLCKVSSSSNTTTPGYVTSKLSIYDLGNIKINSKISMNSTWSVSTTCTNHQRSLVRKCSHESKTTSMIPIKTQK